jgi:hypothetical protein
VNNEKLIFTDSHEADATFASKQYYGCKYGADNHITTMAADTDVSVGIVTNKPASGEAAQVLKVGRCPGVVSEAITYGQKVRIDSGGKVALWEVTDTSTYCIGVCVQGADADGESGVFDFCFPNAIATA